MQRDPRVLVTICALGLFAAAFAFNRTNETIIGAAIGGFNLALGYWLGSSNSSTRKTELLASQTDEP